MNHRKMLYGYQYKMGELSVCQREAETVKRVFTLYLNGYSYQRIADMLNGEHIPFSEETALWDKHKIKRLLENPRYAGKDGYPPIADSDTFQMVQGMIREKGGSAVRPVPGPVRRLEPFLKCAACGADLLMEAADSRVRLQCQRCGIQLDITSTELRQPIREQIASLMPQTQEEAYQPSEEVIRLTNAVNRALEHPDDPDHIVSLIMQGVSARYDCCPTANRELPDIWLDEQRLHQLLSHITVSQDGDITVHFQTP
ncbi:MAG: recombinase family protein [Oscillibacter sp.]|nr:recombinase family protein [Oscillibacter sp.]